MRLLSIIAKAAKSYQLDGAPELKGYL
jgi:hypothetical protein